MNVSSTRLLLASFALAAMAACESTEPPAPSPISGHNKVAATDSNGATVPGGGSAEPGQPGTDTAIAGLPTGPGKIHGQILGQFIVTSPGQDSMTLAPKLAGVTVTMYPCTKEFCAGDSFGSLAATMTTDAEGKFASPTLPGGYYTVIFTPADASGYRGVYAWFYMNPNSDDYQW